MLINSLVVTATKKKGKLVTVNVSTFFTENVAGEKEGNTGVYNVGYVDMGDYRDWRKVVYKSEEEARAGHHKVVAALQAGADLGLYVEPVPELATRRR